MHTAQLVDLEYQKRKQDYEREVQKFEGNVVRYQLKRDDIVVSALVHGLFLPVIANYDCSPSAGKSCFIFLVCSKVSAKTENLPYAGGVMGRERFGICMCTYKLVEY
jgi:hypothetical protein